MPATIVTTVISFLPPPISGPTLYFPRLYIYLDEATDGYTMENNWCPTERFDSNRPGKKNVWKNNGPQVADSIKYKAGRIKQD